MVHIGRRRFALVLGLGALVAMVATAALIRLIGAGTGAAESAAAAFASGATMLAAACSVAALGTFAWLFAPRLGSAPPGGLSDGFQACESRLELVIEAAGLGTFEIEIATGRVWFSKRTAEIVGRSNEQIPNLEAALAITHEDDRALILEAIDEGGRTGLSKMVDVRINSPGGEERRIAARGVAVFDKYGQPTRIVGFIEDITERRRMEEALRGSEGRYRAFAEALPHKLWTIDADALRIYYNCEFERFFGEVGPRLEDRVLLHHPDDREMAAQRRIDAFAAGVPYEIESRLCRKDGVYRWHRIAVAPIKHDGKIYEWVVVAHDIEELKRAEILQLRVNELLEERVAEATKRLREEMAERRKIQDQLHHSQKLDAIGRLTGGIAHDLNNKLQVIGAALDSLALGLRDQPKQRRGLLNAIAATDQAAALIAGLLTFARQKEVQAETIDPATALTSIVDLLDRSLAGSALAIDLAVHDEVWPIEADPVELEAAIMKLVLNARDAVAAGGSGGGVIRIETANIQPGDAPTAEAKLIGECVRITVHDCGEGIAPEHLTKVFEPFFTTKPAGKGTGLGLSQVYGFAKQLGGTATIESEPNRGTSVSLFLPRAAHAPEEPNTAMDEALQAQATRRVADVLIVDDQPDVAAAIASLLEQLGHRTRIAIGVEEAWEALTAQLPELVLTDVAMRTQTEGVEFARAARAKHPGLAVALLTGGARGKSVADDLIVVLKPITAAKLDELVQQCLTGAPVVEAQPIAMV